MIDDIQNQGGAGEKGRMLAVIAGQAARADEVAACFARQGDRVKAVWYANTRQFIEAEQRPRFEAVILFGSPDPAADDVQEAAVRGVTLGTPLYRI